MDKNAIHYLAEIDNLKGSLAAAERRLEQFAQDIAYKLGMSYEPPVEKGDCQYLKGIEDLKERAVAAEARAEEAEKQVEQLKEVVTLRSLAMENFKKSAQHQMTIADQLRAALEAVEIAMDTAAMHGLPQQLPPAYRDSWAEAHTQARALLSPDCQRQAALGGEERE